MKYTGQLSKWWQTPSCEAAWERAKNKKREQIKKLRAYMAAKEAALKAELAREEAEYQSELVSR
jgi:hypothetical protein